MNHETARLIGQRRRVPKGNHAHNGGPGARGSGGCRRDPDGTDGHGDVRPSDEQRCLTHRDHPRCPDRARRFQPAPAKCRPPTEGGPQGGCLVNHAGEHVGDNRAHGLDAGFLGPCADRVDEVEWKGEASDYRPRRSCAAWRLLEHVKTTTPVWASSDTDACKSKIAMPFRARASVMRDRKPG